ncbi:MAG TPA: hypothetical protein VK358_06655, partial [Longimicrobium sp.]|nr:hypothetical protein [Longimicrobium sp.]
PIACIPGVRIPEPPSVRGPMRESDIPPPGDPSMRSSRIWALLIMATVLVFIVWFAAENWGVREPGRNSTGPGVQNAGGGRP